MISKNELIKSLLQEDLAEYWLSLDKGQLAEMLGTDVANMQNFDQRNPHHCYNLLEHCLRTVERITIADRQDKLLRCSALFHDIAKPIVAREKQGRLVFYGHASLSAKLTRPLLKKMGFTFKEATLITFCIYHHDDFISYTDEPAKAKNLGRILITEASIERYIKLLQEQNPYLDEKLTLLYLEKLLKLCKADAGAQSEKVYTNGVLADSRQSKIARLEKIEKIIFQTLKQIL